VDLSVKGDEDIRLFDQEVEPIYLSHIILERLTKPERMKLVSKAFESRDWYSLVPRPGSCVETTSHQNFARKPPRTTCGSGYCRTKVRPIPLLTLR
jgi:hypothetical protein